MKDGYNKFIQPAEGVRDAGEGPSPEEVDKAAMKKADEDLEEEKGQS